MLCEWIKGNKGKICHKLPCISGSAAYLLLVKVSAKTYFKGWGGKYCFSREVWEKIMHWKKKMVWKHFFLQKLVNFRKKWQVTHWNKCDFFEVELYFFVKHTTIIIFIFFEKSFFYSEVMSSSTAHIHAFRFVGP